MITLSRKQQMTFQYLCIIAVVIIVGYVFLSIDISRPLSFFKSNEFIGVALSVLCIGILWHILSGKSQRFPVEISKKRYTIKKERFVQPISKEITVTRFGFVGGVIGYILAIAFSFNMCILIVVAYLSGTGRVTVDFNHFGEMLIEIILFFACLVLILSGFYFTYQNLKRGLRK